MLWVLQCFLMLLRSKMHPDQRVCHLLFLRKNASYEESEEEYEEDDEDDEVDEDDEDDDEEDYESDVPVPRKSQPSRPVSAKRKVEVQPGPSRDSSKTVEKMQRRDAGAKRYVKESVDEDETEPEDEIKEKREVRRFLLIKDTFDYFWLMRNMEYQISSLQI